MYCLFLAYIYFIINIQQGTKKSRRRTEESNLTPKRCVTISSRTLSPSRIALRIIIVPPPGFEPGLKP